MEAPTIRRKAQTLMAFYANCDESERAHSAKLINPYADKGVRIDKKAHWHANWQASSNASGQTAGIESPTVYTAAELIAALAGAGSEGIVFCKDGSLNMANGIAKKRKHHKFWHIVAQAAAALQKGMLLPEGYQISVRTNDVIIVKG